MSYLRYLCLLVHSGVQHILLFSFSSSCVSNEELIVPYTTGRSLRSENECLLQQPRDVRTKAYGERRFNRAGATLWNDLPIHLRKEQSLPLFKKGLKTHIFRKAYCDV